MQITLDQDEISQYVEDGVRRQFNFDENQSISIDFTMGRNPAGLVAALDIKGQNTAASKPVTRRSAPVEDVKQDMVEPAAADDSADQQAEPEPKPEPEATPEPEAENDADTTVQPADDEPKVDETKAADVKEPDAKPAATPKKNIFGAPRKAEPTDEGETAPAKQAETRPARGSVFSKVKT